MSNPKVRPYLHFMPEDAGGHLSEAWQANRWLNELDPSLTTPMARKDNQDFFIFEPCVLRDGTVCMPYRWIVRGDEIHARVWAMIPDHGRQGWIVQEHVTRDVPLSEFDLSLPHFAQSVVFREGVPSPHMLLGMLSPLHLYDLPSRLRQVPQAHTWMNLTASMAGPEPIQKSVIPGEKKPQVTAFLHSLSGYIATIHPGMFQRSGISIIHFFSLLLAFHVVLFTKNITSTSYLHLTPLPHSRCLTHWLIN